MEFLDVNGLKTLCNEIKKYISNIKESLEQNTVDIEKFKTTLGVDPGEVMDAPGWQGQPYDPASVNSVLQQLARFVSTIEDNYITPQNIPAALTRVLRTVGGQSLLKGPGLNNDIPLPDTSDLLSIDQFVHVMGNDDVLTYRDEDAPMQTHLDKIGDQIMSLEENPMILHASSQVINNKSQLALLKVNDIAYCRCELDDANIGTNKSTVNTFIIKHSNNQYGFAEAPYNTYNADGTVEANASNFYITYPQDGGIYVIMKSPFGLDEKLDLVNINRYFAELINFYEDFNPDFGETFGILMGECFNWEGSNGSQLQTILDQISTYINSFKSKLNYVEVFIEGLDNGVPKITPEDLEKINNNNPSYIIINGSWCQISNGSIKGHFTVADNLNDFHTTVYSGIFVLGPDGSIVIDQGAAENLDEKFQYKLTNTSQLATINDTPLYYGGNIRVTTDLSGIEQAINEQNSRIDALEQKINTLTEIVNNLNK